MDFVPKNGECMASFLVSSIRSTWLHSHSTSSVILSRLSSIVPCCAGAVLALTEAFRISLWVRSTLIACHMARMGSTFPPPITEQKTTARDSCRSFQLRITAAELAQHRRVPCDLAEEWVRDARHLNRQACSRDRRFSMSEIEAALKTQGKYISPVLLELGWRRKRIWSTTG
jgi:hypothetical protein